jgi:Flp pilus assembly protein TadB
VTSAASRRRGDEPRVNVARMWLSALAAVLLAVAACLAYLWSNVFFTVALIVLTVFALVELRWTVRRRRSP